MATGWRILATEQACYDILMQEVVRKRWDREGSQRGVFCFFLIVIRAVAQFAAAL